MKQVAIWMKFLLAVLAIFNLTAVRAQEYYNYVQTTNNLTPLNSAYSLLDKNTSLNAAIKKQLLGINGAPTTFLFNANLPVESMNAAAGLIVLDDKIAVEHLTEINLFFAKSVQLTESSYLGLSLNGGIRRYVAGYSSLDPNDPQFANDIRKTQPNIGFGVMFYGDNYYIGVSVPELTIKSLGVASADNQANLKSHYNFSAAYLIEASEDMIFKPAALVTYTRGTPVLADFLSTLYFKKTVGFGFDYRTNNVMTGVLSMCLDKYQFGYSYQLPTTNNNLGINFATHSISFTCRFGKNLSERKIL